MPTASLLVRGVSLWVVACIPASFSRGVSAETISLDCEKVVGDIRPLQGGNDGPIQSGGLVDLSQFHRELSIPFTRLHDCRWPNTDVVDIHNVFPNPQADPRNPANYDFARTDDCIEAVRKTGAQVVYRLGESIEHTPRKYHVNPPADFDNWAAACVGIIQHYNDGWAGGFHDAIRYWEIWNEPENRPRCWTGSDEQYFTLYEKTAKAIKSHWPDLKVGGPSLGYTGKIVAGHFEPGEFMLHFLEYCKSHALPLDFFSWHLYGNDPGEYLIRARGIRQLLNDRGWEKTEMHLNEWNYLPGNQWLSAGPESQGPTREKYFERMTGLEGAAFCAAVLMALQDSPVDVANFFAANTQPLGLFSQHGTPHKTYYAFKAFRELLDTPRRLQLTGSLPGVWMCAGINADRTQIGILLSKVEGGDGTISIRIVHLPWNGESVFDVLTVDGTHNLERIDARAFDPSNQTIPLDMTTSSMFLLKIHISRSR